MQFRVYALYDCSKKVLLVNGALFLTEVVAISTMLALDFRQRARRAYQSYFPTFCDADAGVY